MLTVLIWVAVAGAGLLMFAGGSGGGSQATATTGPATALPTTLPVPLPKVPTPASAYEALRTLKAFAAAYAADDKDMDALITKCAPMVVNATEKR